MAKLGNCDFEQLKKLEAKLERLQGNKEFYAFCESCAKELAARLLRKVIKRTPVGDYSKEIEVVAKRDSKHHKKGDVYKKTINPDGKVGGTLRRGWTANSENEAKSGGDVNAFVDALKVHYYGGYYVIKITNPVHYASYVEFGHRTRNGKGWVKGQFMLTISEQELQTQAPSIIEKKLTKYLEECFNGK